MRRIVALMCLLCIFASLAPLTVQAAAGYSTDFESFANGTPAASLTVPGVTFVSNSGGWQIYSPYAYVPNVVGNVLGSFGGDLTMQFATLQGSVQFGYASNADVTVTGYRNGAVVKTVTVPPGSVVTGTVFSIQDAGGFDTVMVSSTTDVVIDNLVTNGVDASACLIPPLDNAVVGKFVSAAAIFWEPGKQTEPVAIIGVGESAWVYGLDATGQYYKIAWSCQTRWVQKDTMGPNYDDVWQGRPLPTTTIGD